MELEEAIKNIKRDSATPLACGECTICNIEDLETLLNHLTKQDKMIELMAREIDNLADDRYGKHRVEETEVHIKEIKQYFEKKAEESE